MDEHRRRRRAAVPGGRGWLAMGVSLAFVGIAVTAVVVTHPSCQPSAPGATSGARDLAAPGIGAGADTGPGAGEQTGGSAAGLGHTYRIDTYPGTVNVYVDDESRPHEMAFTTRLAEGPHRFHLVHPARGVDVTLHYTVSRGDSVRVLRLDYLSRRVTPLR